MFEYWHHIIVSIQRPWCSLLWPVIHLAFCVTWNPIGKCFKIKANRNWAMLKTSYNLFTDYITRICQRGNYLKHLVLYFVSHCMSRQLTFILFIFLLFVHLVPLMLYVSEDSLSDSSFHKDHSNLPRCFSLEYGHNNNVWCIHALWGGRGLLTVYSGTCFYLTLFEYLKILKSFFEMSGCCFMCPSCQHL